MLKHLFYIICTVPRDHSAMTSCLEAGRSWDSSSCSCVCPPSKICTEGQILDPISCACLLKESQVISSNPICHSNDKKLSICLDSCHARCNQELAYFVSQGLQNVYLEERTARRASTPFLLDWEHLAMIILGCLNVIFLIIIVVLVNRNHTLNRMLKKDTQRYAW